MKLRNEKTAGERLLDVVEYRKLGSRAALAEALGVTSGAIYTAIKRGEITKQMALSVQGALGISAEWILSGKGPVEAGPKLSIDFQMKLEMLSHIRDLRSQIPKTLAWFWLSDARTYQTKAFHALAWKVHGSDLFYRDLGNWAFSIELKDPQRFKAYSKKYSNYEKICEEIFILLSNVHKSKADQLKLNVNVFDDDLISTLQTRVYADLNEQLYLDKWTTETQHLSDAKRTALMSVYDFACELKFDAENEFLPSEFGRDYAEGMLYDEDPNAIKFAGSLTKKFIDDFWYGKIDTRELYQRLRENK